MRNGPEALEEQESHHFIDADGFPLLPVSRPTFRRTYGRKGRTGVIGVGGTMNINIGLGL